MRFLTPDVFCFRAGRYLKLTPDLVFEVWRAGRYLKLTPEETCTVRYLKLATVFILKTGGYLQLVPG